MEIITLLIFIVICLGLGYSALQLVKPKPVIETVLLSFVIGLAILPLLIFLMRVLHIPMDVRIVGPISIVGVAIGVWRQHIGGWKMPFIRVVGLAVAVIAMLYVADMMYEGATKYPYLEDDDPWSHAVGARYVAMERTTDQGDITFAHYLDPYPPYYSAMMGILHQTTLDLQWVLKFFNALLIGMSILAAYFAFELLFKDSLKAAAAAAILGFIPAYMSHFIWSQTLAIPVFLIALWGLEHWRQAITDEETETTSTTKTKKSKTHDAHDNASLLSGWWKRGEFWLAVILVWSATIIQPSTTAVFAVLLMVYAIVVGGVMTMAKGDWRRWPVAHSLPVVIGGIASLLTWSYFAIVYGWSRMAEQIGINIGTVTSRTGDTSGGIVYGLKDIIFAPMSSKIDQATGLGGAGFTGILVPLLAFVAIIIILFNWRKLFTQKNAGILFLLVFLIISIIGVQGNALPYKLFPHRFWVFLAIPTAALAAYAIFAFAAAVPQRALRYAVVAIVVLMAVWTMLPARTAVQQAIWPPGAMWSSNEEIAGYSGLPGMLPIGSRVFAPCADDARLIGLNMAAEPWNLEQRAIKERFGNSTTQEVVAHMTSQNYEYIILDTTCVKNYGPERTMQIAEALSTSGRFTQVQSSPGFVLARLI